MRVIAVLRTLDDLEAVAHSWRDLLVDMPVPSVFQTPEWCIEWWRAFGDGQLHVLVNRQGGQIEAIAPLFLRSTKDGHVPSLVIIGTGNSDHLDLVGAGTEPSMETVDIGAGMAEAEGWSLDWRRLPRTSPLLWACSSGLIGHEDPCPVLSLPNAYSTLERGLAHGLRHRLEYGQRRLAREGSVAFEYVRGAAIHQGLEELFQLHAARWGRKGGSGVLGDPRVQRFHHAAARRLDASGELRLVRMTVGEATAAIYYGHQIGTSASFYIAGFDPAFGYASPGNLLLREVLRHAIDEGVCRFDFLSGREPYKYEWGAVDQPFFSRVLVREAQAVRT